MAGTAALNATSPMLPRPPGLTTARTTSALVATRRTPAPVLLCASSVCASVCASSLVSEGIIATIRPGGSPNSAQSVIAPLKMSRTSSSESRVNGFCGLTTTTMPSWPKTPAPFALRCAANRTSHGPLCVRSNCDRGTPDFSAYARTTSAAKCSVMLERQTWSAFETGGRCAAVGRSTATAAIAATATDAATIATRFPVRERGIGGAGASAGGSPASNCASASSAERPPNGAAASGSSASPHAGQYSPGPG